MEGWQNAGLAEDPAESSDVSIDIDRMSETITITETAGNYVSTFDLPFSEIEVQEWELSLILSNEIYRDGWIQGVFMESHDYSTDFERI